MKNLFLCRAPRQRHACYIMTIGVLDECRKLGLGTLLLNYTCQMVAESEWTDTCEIIYLHVVTYNEIALKFYRKNGFSRLQVLKQHYEILGKPYDAVVLFKRLS
mgnify:CR=1 FL=1